MAGTRETEGREGVAVGPKVHNKAFCDVLRDAVRKRGFDGGTGVKRTENGDGCDRRTRELGTNVCCDTCQPDDPNIHGIAGVPYGFELLSAVIVQAQVEIFSAYRLLQHLTMFLELIANRRTNEIRSVRIETVGDCQIDVTEIHKSEVDRDLLGLGNTRWTLIGSAHAAHLSVVRHPLTIRVDVTRLGGRSQPLP